MWPDNGWAQVGIVAVLYLLGMVITAWVCAACLDETTTTVADETGATRKVDATPDMEMAVILLWPLGAVIAGIIGLLYLAWSRGLRFARRREQRRAELAEVEAELSGMPPIPPIMPGRKDLPRPYPARPPPPRWSTSRPR